MNHDLTVGEPKKVLVRFTVPLFGSVLLQQMYNLVDSIVAGKYIGKNALAAISDSYELTLVYLAFAFGCNVGCSVIVSHLFGAGRKKDLKTAVSTTFLASGVLCVLLMTLGFAFGRTLLLAIDTPEAVLGDALLYLHIYTAGLLPLFFYNIATGVFSALGDSGTPFRFLAISSLSNIALDVLFVVALDLGVAGVAWATFLCQTASCVLAVVALLKRLGRLGGERFCLFSFPIFKQVVAVAVPSVLQQSFVSVGNILIQKAVNGYFDTEWLSTAMMAGYGAAVKLNNLTVNCLMTVANGISNFTGQNLGARKPERIRAGYRAAVGTVACIAAAFGVLYLTAGRLLLGLFSDASGSEAVRIGFAFLLCVSPFYFVVGCKLISDGVLRGAGEMRYFMLTTFTDLILRVILAFLLPRVLPSDVGVGIWLAWPIGWGISASMSVWFYRRGKWKQKHLA